MVRTIAVFDHGGVDRASVVYHLAWMYAELDYRVVVADLNSQARLTSLFLDYAQIQALLGEAPPKGTIYSALLPLLRGDGAEVRTPHVIEIAPGLGLVAGDMLLSLAADRLAQAWQQCADAAGDVGLDGTVYIWRALKLAATSRSADLVLMDVGGFDPVSRAALVAADHVVVHLEFGPYSLPGIREIGDALKYWRLDWQRRRELSSTALDLPKGTMKSVGYIAVPPASHIQRPAEDYVEWLQGVPDDYGRYVEGNPTLSRRSTQLARDGRCLGHLRHFVTLRSLAEDARKPIFAMKPADGILGGYGDVVRGCYNDFRALATEIATRCGLPPPA